MRLIGITGFKTSGKDTTFKAVEVALPNKTVKRVAFADKLKELSALALGFDGDSDDLIARMDDAKEYWDFYITDHAGFAHDLTGRKYLQNIGQGARKVFTSNFWVDMVLPPPSGYTHDASDAVLHDRYPGVDVLCVTDVRYPNEADRVHELGGEIWEIIRPGLESDGHSSEIPLDRDKVDLSIFNGFEIETLYTSVGAILAGVRGPQETIHF